MSSQFKVLAAVLPVALLAGPLGAGSAAADPNRTALIQIPATQMVPSQVVPPQVAPPRAAAPKAAPAEITPYAATYEGHVTVHDDRTATDLFTKRFKILTPSAIALVSQQMETYIDGMETLDTV